MHRCPTVLLSLTVVCSLFCPGRWPGVAAETTAPIKIGFRKQLLVDDYVVARRSGLKRSLGKATKLNDGKPLLVVDEPWETNAGFYGTVLHDSEKFQMWYRVRRDPWALGYAESVDGLVWRKPKLGLVEMDGNKQNNIINRDWGWTFTCFIDPHETDPAHRYKACYGDRRKARACLAHSPDGIRWTSYNGGEPVTGRAADTCNQLLWDADANVYRLFTRSDFGSNAGTGEIRGTRGMTNPDVKANPTNWTTVRSWKLDREGADEARRRQLYQLTDWIYEGVHFALLFVFEWPDDRSEGGHDLHKRHERNVLSFYIATSRDGDDWDLSWVYAEKPLVPRGPDGSFDKDWVQPSSLFITHADRHWIYYAGSKERHGMSPYEQSIGAATFRLDGLVFLQAADEPGTLVTKPFVLEGKDIAINAAARSGEMVIEILDAAGQPIPGFTRADAEPLDGKDGLRLRPRWSSRSPASLEGRTVRLRFTLKNASLYAFRVTKG
jgi:hypothetical protein